MRNVRFAYMYRDASNWKNQAEPVVFANPDGITTVEAGRRLEAAFDDGEYFIAEQVGLQNVFLWDEDADYDRDNPPANLGPGQYCVNEDDHSWHEWVRYQGDPPTLQETDRCVTDPRTLAEFLGAVEQAAEDGWKEFAVVARG